MERYTQTARQFYSNETYSNKFWEFYINLHVHAQILVVDTYYNYVIVFQVY